MVTSISTPQLNMVRASTTNGIRSHKIDRRSESYCSKVVRRKATRGADRQMLSLQRSILGIGRAFCSRTDMVSRWWDSHRRHIIPLRNDNVPKLREHQLSQRGDAWFDIRKCSWRDRCPDGNLEWLTILNQAPAELPNAKLCKSRRARELKPLISSARARSWL